MNLLPMNSYVEVILRSAVVYLFVIIAMRIFGKKELGQLSVVDLVLIMLISNSVQNAMVGNNTSLSGGLTAAASLFVINYFLKLFLYKNPLLNRFLEGSPVLLIHKGKLIKKNMSREKLSLAELELAAREHGVASIEEVDLAVLETDGTISVLSKNYQNKSNKKTKYTNKSIKD